MGTANLNTEKQRFELVIDGHLSHIEFKPDSPNVWRLVHTFVPSEIGGHGVAAHLTLQTLNYCKANNIKVIPECSYIIKYIERHPEWKSLLHQ